MRGHDPNRPEAEVTVPGPSLGTFKFLVIVQVPREQASSPRSSVPYCGPRMVTRTRAPCSLGARGNLAARRRGSKDGRVPFPSESVRP